MPDRVPRFPPTMVVQERKDVVISRDIRWCNNLFSLSTSRVKIHTHVTVQKWTLRCNSTSASGILPESTIG